MHTNNHLQIAANQDIRLSQRLMMTAHMQQAIRLLQLPLQDLEPFLEEQVVLNPFLEISENETRQAGKEAEKEENEEKELTISEHDLSILQRLDEDLKDHFGQNDMPLHKPTLEEERLKSFQDQSIYAEPTLSEELLRQARETFEDEEERKIAEIIIGYIDAFGFMNTPLAEICALHRLEEEKVKNVLNEVQTFEPFGVGASSIQEALLIQLRCTGKKDSLAYQIVQDYYEDLLHNQIPHMQKNLKCSYEDIQQAIEKDIAKLDLHPGTHLSSHPVHAIVPDVTLRQEGEKLIVDVEREKIPSLRLNDRYLKMLNDSKTAQETRLFLKQHLFSAKWLMRNLQQRFSTIERIAQSLAERQSVFFLSPTGKLVPLTMKTLAEELGLHESTIARTVSNKYLYCQRGLFPLRSFFTTKYVSEEGADLSSTTVKQEILNLLSNEDKKRPLSDEKISLLLKEKGITCARRTVAKYRTILKIGNTQQRKKFN